MYLYSSATTFSQLSTPSDDKVKVTMNKACVDENYVKATQKGQQRKLVVQTRQLQHDGQTC